MNQDEDFFVPLRSGPKRPETSPEEQAEDLAYFRKNLFAALKIPEEYVRSSDS
jgi:hypothetical protein